VVPKSSQLLSSSLRRQRSSTQEDARMNSTQQMMGSSLSRILTHDQRALFNQVNKLASVSRSLARKVGNMPVKEDSLLADIARLRTQRQLRCKQQRSTKQQQQTKNESNEDTIPPSLFTVVFAGEFNSGKSTLINALLGNEMLDTGVLPTTDAITIMMSNDGDADFDEDTSSVVESSSIGLGNGFPHTELHLLPTTKFPILSDLCLIDTPGTNAILSLQHTSSTLRILHDADLIVFVTSADRPFSESEKQLLKTSIKSYRKRVVMVINKMDVLERQQGEDHGSTTKKRVEEYVVEHAGDLLGARPVVIPLSARDALSVKLLYKSNGTSSDVASSGDNQPTLWKRSNFGALEHFLSKTLTSSSKVKTKLLNPIGVSEGILVDCQKEIRRRQEELDVDVATLRLLTNQTDAWAKEIQSEVIDGCRSNVRDAIVQKSESAKRVLDEISWLDQWKMGMGLGSAIFHRAWVNATRCGRGTLTHKAQASDSCRSSLENELLHITGDFADMLSSRAQTQGSASIEYLGKRPIIIGSGGSKAGNDGSGVMSRMVGSVSVPKFRRLKELRPSVTAAIQNSASDLPSDSQYSDRVYKSLRRTALLSSILVGSAAVPATLSVLDILDATTGMTATATLAILGVMTMPLGNRSTVMTSEKERIDDAAHVETALEKLFEESLNQIRSELSESISPYSRYVSTEVELLKDLALNLERGISSAHALRSKINKACQ